MGTDFVRGSWLFPLASMESPAWGRPQKEMAGNCPLPHTEVRETLECRKCACVCLRVQACVFAHACACPCVPVHASMRVCTCMCMPVCACTCKHGCLHLRVHAHVCACVCTGAYVYMLVPCMCVCFQASTCTPRSVKMTPLSPTSVRITWAFAGTSGHYGFKDPATPWLGARMRL